MRRGNTYTEDYEVRMMDIRQACAYTGMGRNSFMKWADTIGAKRRFGRSVRYDRRVIDKALDDMAIQQKVSKQSLPAFFEGYVDGLTIAHEEGSENGSKQ